MPIFVRRSLTLFNLYTRVKTKSKLVCKSYLNLLYTYDLLWLLTYSDLLDLSLSTYDLYIVVLLFTAFSIISICTFPYLHSFVFTSCLHPYLESVWLNLYWWIDDLT